MGLTRRWRALLLVLLLLGLAACAKKTKPEEQAASLEKVRAQAATAFDGTLSSTRRRNAAEEATRLLVGLLSQRESLAISEAEWAEPPRAGTDGLARHFDLGALHLYALALPGDTLGETRERAVLQVRQAEGAPQAMELPLRQGSRVAAVRSLEDGGRPTLTLLAVHADGSGYLAHYRADGQGRFALAADAFAGMEGRYDQITLSRSDGFLLVAPEEGAGWETAFDPNHPLRLRLGPDLTLEWQQRFTLVDERRFDPFALLHIAADPKLCTTPANCPESLREMGRIAPEQVAKAAWEKGTQRLLALLTDPKTRLDDLVARAGSAMRVIQASGSDLSVQLLSVAAPANSGLAPFTAVLHGAGGGLQTAGPVALDGTAVEARLLTHGGSPALLLVADREMGLRSMGFKSIHLFHLTAEGNWQPATDWVGTLPDDPASLFRSTGPGDLTVQWEQIDASGVAVTLGMGDPPAVSACGPTGNCQTLIWMGGRLAGTSLVAERVSALSRLRAGRAEAESAVEALAQFLAGQAVDQINARDLNALSSSLTILEGADGTKVVGLPATPSGFSGAVIRAGDATTTLITTGGAVSRWDSAHLLEDGGERRLVVIGRSATGFALITYRWDGAGWALVDPLNERVDQTLGSGARIRYTPGQQEPVPGIQVTGRDLVVTPMNQAISICNRTTCTTYAYEIDWKLQQRVNR